ncbi:MAG: hypothetical protein ABDH19_01870 [Thermodesulfovibrio sp.]
MVNGSIELIAVPFNSIDEEIEFLRNIQKEFIPDIILLIRAPKIEKISERTKNLKVVNGKTTYYLCKNYICH